MARLLTTVIQKRDKAMLVLSRKRSESIVIKDNVVVTIVSIQGDKVRLGFEAPREVTVHRSEVYKAIKRSQKSGRSDQGDVPPAE